VLTANEQDNGEGQIYRTEISSIKCDTFDYVSKTPTRSCHLIL